MLAREPFKPVFNGLQEIISHLHEITSFYDWEITFSDLVRKRLLDILRSTKALSRKKLELEAERDSLKTLQEFLKEQAKEDRELRREETNRQRELMKEIANRQHELMREVVSTIKTPKQRESKKKIEKRVEDLKKKYRASNKFKGKTYKQKGNDHQSPKKRKHFR